VIFFNQFTTENTREPGKPVSQREKCDHGSTGGSRHHTNLTSRATQGRSPTHPPHLPSPTLHHCAGALPPLPRAAELSTPGPAAATATAATCPGQKNSQVQPVVPPAQARASPAPPPPCCPGQRSSRLRGVSRSRLVAVSSSLCSFRRLGRRGWPWRWTCPIMLRLLSQVPISRLPR
jgi:hypothetical protein